jgi:hypothetical protein
MAAIAVPSFMRYQQASAAAAFQPQPVEAEGDLNDELKRAIERANELDRAAETNARAIEGGVERIQEGALVSPPRTRTERRVADRPAPKKRTQPARVRTEERPSRPAPKRAPADEDIGY